jgi:hypothetical protein
MSNKKQTAVEWLEEQLIGKNGINVLKDTFNQAKEMEKQQIIDACNSGLSGIPRSSKQYYDETFKQL